VILVNFLEVENLS